MDLSKDADILICAIYKAYLDKRKSGEDKLKAKSFADPILIQTAYLPKESPADVMDSCRELGNAGFIKALYANNRVKQFILDDAGIIYMETRFGRKLEKFLDYFDKLKL